MNSCGDLKLDHPHPEVQDTAACAVGGLPEGRMRQLGEVAIPSALCAEPKNGAFAPVGECIYCGQTKGKLTTEHILMYALGGNILLPKSSCETCGKRTSKFEQFIARDMWGMARAALKYPTRNKHRIARGYPVIAQPKNTGAVKFLMPADKLPFMLAFPELPLPGFFTGQTIDTFSAKAVQCRPERFKPFGNQRVYIGALDLQIFSQFLAKTAHALARAQLGSTFQPLLLDVIAGSRGSASDFIGTLRPELEAEDATHHRMQLVPLESGGQHYVGALIRLFAHFGAPEYVVVVGGTGDKIHPVFAENLRNLPPGAWRPPLFFPYGQGGGSA